ncbi:hypothetical protein DFJ75_0740 [Williamsia muralis]|uniref:Transcriptional regulator, AbiEi antitoxin, Type IV TA system n=1 Tax=Williamsia marianensis TaxID=85044 RepID=A0A495JYI9_WILMA|nr:hypothetical protein [Williamsia muralis]RKR93951.1 hypothetical protein DFJ75_0740 [Williamsia muralis]
MDPFEDLELVYRSQLVESTMGDDAYIRRAVVGGELQRVVRGVLMPPDPTLTPEQQYLRRIVGTCRRTRGPRVLSHQSAALLHGLSMAGRAYQHVHYIVERGAEITTGVYKHHGVLTDDDVVVIGPIRVTSLARTAADVACAGDFSSALVVLDSALRKGVSFELLVEIADRLGGTPGISTLRAALRYADGKSESAGESESRAGMIEMGDIPLPRLQHEFRLPCGTFLARSDFDWKGKVIGEFDGRSKYTSDGRVADESWHAERERHNRLERHGFKVVRWDYKIVRDRKAFRNILRQALRVGGVI